MDSLRQDIRYAFRSFARQPALTLIAVLSLGLAIGATSTVFTWLQGMVLDPLPAIPRWDRIVVAHTRNPDGGNWSVSWPDFQDWRASSRTADFAAWDMLPVGLKDGSGPAERAWSQLVSGNYFEDLQVGAALGRVLRMEDEEQRLPVAVLGHSYWRRRFAGDSAIVGRTITLNGQSFTVVGVAAERHVGNYIGMDLHIYVPMTNFPILTAEGTALLQERQRRSIEVIGRLKDGITLEQAQAELDPLARRAGEAGGLAQPLGAVVRMHSNVDAPGAMRPMLGALLAIAGLVLLIACANIASLLLARAMSRRREIAVRLAVGASRRRLIRQLLTESLALATMAGLFGVVMTFWTRDTLMALLPTVPYPVFLDFTLDARVVAFATAITAIAAIAFGLMPALRASRPDLVPTLKDEIGEGSGSRGTLQGALVVAQVALSLVALVAAGLFVRSMEEYRRIDNGMSGLGRVMLVNTDLRLSGLRNDSVNVALVRSVLERVRALPGVEAAAVARAVPLGPAPLTSSGTRIEGYTPGPDENMHVAQNDVSDGYFDAVGIRLIEGRTLTDADMSGNAPVAVVNEAFARRFLSGRAALGARVNMGGDDWLEVVGVVATTKVNDYAEDARPVVYRAYSNRFAPAGFAVHVRSRGSEPLALASAVRGAFAEVSTELPFLDTRVMSEWAGIGYWPQRVGAIMLAVVGVLALILASVGIYGTMAYTVSRRVREIGVRVALGAARGQIVRLILGRGLRLTGLGVSMGLGLGLLVGKALSSQLYGVSAADPATFIVVGVLLTSVTLLACAVPARRAARVDPMIALRSE